MTEPIDAHFTATLLAMADGAGPPLDAERDEFGPVVAGSTLTVRRALDVFDAQIGSRHLDLAARAMRAQGRGYYTIGSSGHESNAAVAAALRPTDPALLHYRSGAFFLARAQQVEGSDPLRDVLLGIAAVTAEPISGGRHKVFGRHDLNIIPQTSTIASHLPRAVGVAFSIERAHRLGVPGAWAADAIAVCSFGDASVNHSTAVGAVNTAIQTAYQGVPLPLLFVCEDNGIGISTRTPQGWIETNYANRAGLPYFAADGDDLPATYATARAAADWVRRQRRPAFLHLRTVRLMAHAGSDYEQAYRSAREITDDYARDPVLATAQLLVRTGHRTVAEVLERYEHTRGVVTGLAKEVVDLPQLDSAAAVMAPLTETTRDAIAASEDAPATPEGGAGLTLAQAINAGLRDTLERYPGAIVFGEDVARKGGVYGVTRGLQKGFGSARVFDTVLDEQAILGMALGSGVSGLLPVAEIQYLAYVHNAADQIRGEGATLQYFSNRQYRNPGIVRIAGYAYQKGFGGHFHNDNSVAALLDIPGVVVASPAHPDDARAMLGACAAAAERAGALCLFLEPIALYHTPDLHTAGDGKWLSGPAVAPATIGTARTHRDGNDLTILTFANGLHMSLRVAQRLADTHGIDARVVDLRWLAPLPTDDILREAGGTGRVLVVDETRRTGGVGQAIVTTLVEHGFDGAIARVAGADSFVPLGDAALKILVSERDIEDAAVDLVKRTT